MKKNIEILENKILSKRWATLHEVTYKYPKKNGETQILNREVYDKGDGSAIILYNLEKKTIILTKQFRMPAYLKGGNSGYMIEACAGLLDDLSPEACIVKETLEETGYKIENPKKLFQSFMIAGAVTEVIHCFIAPYSDKMKIQKGGGLEEEGEEIEILEVEFDKAYGMIASGEITDAKTILILQHMKIQKIMEYPYKKLS
ncbi:NUDIX domain-containing protein [Zunongwangia sp.]|uniref:NUDIX domain-containing protein n=1 Tax=Zunongwangia sp. TaxID=1965325 RepID=UPI003AA86857